MIHGRVIARDTDQILVRTGSGEQRYPAGNAKPGDLIRCRPDALPEVVVPYSGPEYPGAHSEVTRLSEERITGLRARAIVLREVRRYFDEQDFLEVEPPVLVPTPGLEVNIKAVPAQGGYLITSPEFSMKRLLAGGLDRIYATCRCFRSEEVGAHHNTEFTMLEWYRSWATLEDILHDTEQLVCRTVAAVRGHETAVVSGRDINVSVPWRRMSVAEAFELWAGFKLTGEESAASLRGKVQAAGMDCREIREWDELFYLVFVERIDPGLTALDHAIILVDWPAPLAALARTKPGAPQWALRFEAYIGGVELANAFDELTDPKEQRKRFEDEQDTRRRRGYEVYPLDEKFLAALHEGLPPCSGIALGIDRLAMISVGADELRTVSAFCGDEL